MGIFSNFTCPVCNQTFGFMQKTSSKIGNRILCSDCARMRSDYKMNMIRNKLSNEEIEENMEKYDRAIIEKTLDLENRKNRFIPTVSYGSYVSFDDNNKLFSFPKSKCAAVFSYDELLNYDVIEDGSTVTSGGLGKALVGGAFFGLAGVIAGGTSKKQKNYCESLQIKVTIKNSNNPVVYIDLINFKVSKNSITYKNCSKLVQDILSKFEVVSSMVNAETNSNEGENKQVENNFSVADEIKKFKELLDMGAITQEEFDKKKKELLK